MKYTISINQYAVVKQGLDVDLIDMAIFDFIKDFANSSACVKIQTPEGVYFWISHSLILQEIPLLNIKTKAGLSKRIDNLINAGLLRKHPNCDKYSKTLYSFGENYDCVSFTTPETEVCTPTTEVYTPQQKFRAPINKSLGVPPNKSLGDNNIIEYNITDNNKEGEHGSPAPQETDESDFVLIYPTSTEVREREKVPQKREREPRGTTESTMCLFSNSRYADFEDFKKCFEGAEFEGVDIAYYYHSVADWSASKGAKKKDWIATARGFMRRDNDAGKLKRIAQQQQPMTQEDYEGMMRYLKGDY